MVTKKVKRNSGRRWPQFIEQGMEMYVQKIWDNWIDWRDGSRNLTGSESWKDKSKKRKQYL